MLLLKFMKNVKIICIQEFKTIDSLYFSYEKDVMNKIYYRGEIKNKISAKKAE